MQSDSHVYLLAPRECRVNRSQRALSALIDLNSRPKRVIRFFSYYQCESIEANSRIYDGHIMSSGSSGIVKDLSRADGNLLSASDLTVSRVSQYSFTPAIKRHRINHRRTVDRCAEKSLHLRHQYFPRLVLQSSIYCNKGTK